MIRIVLTSIIFAGIHFTAIAQHLLKAPDGWEGEVFPFPIEFAPNIPYQGVEEVKFTPGWGNTNSEELWSYCFLWWINEDSKIDERSLKTHLTEYYNGLVGRNIIRRNIESAKVVPTVVTVRKSNATPFVYSANVDMLDYMSQKPVTLNVNIYMKECKEGGKKAVFFAISPQPDSHRLWKDYASIWEAFTCAP